MSPSSLTGLVDYRDERDNRIVCLGDTAAEEVAIRFGGEGNRLVVTTGARLRRLSVEFRGSGAVLHIGACGASLTVLLGSRSQVRLGGGLSTTGTLYMTAFEGSAITIGEDCMVAGGVQIRADDSHPIFDVRSGRRVNRSRPVTVGDHVWLGEGAVLLQGSTVGSGSIVGTRAVVKGRFANNCALAGVPARVTRRDVAWERTHLSQESRFTAEGGLTEPGGGRYWCITEEAAGEP
jgi:carbonic anhydrase/acetyltransferase-like protein (isoleucine patch superfamily)